MKQHVSMKKLGSFVFVAAGMALANTKSGADVCWTGVYWDYIRGVGEGSACWTNCTPSHGTCAETDGAGRAKCIVQATTVTCDRGVEQWVSNQLVCVATGGTQVVNVNYPILLGGTCN